MADREKVISCLTDIENIMIARQDICPREELQYWIELQEGVADALALLKEHEDEKKRIMKVIWDTLHEGLSIDTVADQDWVYEQIRHRIEDT